MQLIMFLWSVIVKKVNELAFRKKKKLTETVTTINFSKVHVFYGIRNGFYFWQM